jgi:hypothetical protein
MSSLLDIKKSFSDHNQWNNLEYNGPYGWIYKYNSFEKIFTESDELFINLLIKENYVNNPYVSHYTRKGKCTVIAKLFITPESKIFGDIKHTFNLDVMVMAGEIIPYNIFFFS